MALQTACEHCGFSYSVKPDMAGKKVRCRNCGQVFAVNIGGAEAGADRPSQPSADQPSDLGLPALDDLPMEAPAPSPYERNSESTRVMPAITTTESNMTGGIGSAKSSMERTGDPGTFDVAGGTPVAANLRPSTPYDFPFARELDYYGTKVLLWLLLLWAVWRAYAWVPRLEEGLHQPDWSGILPAATILLLFAAVWLPIFALAMRKVAAAMKFALPPQHKTRAAALAAIPFALGGVFWFGGETTGTLITGIILGVAVAVPVAWFLYRLQEKEIPYAAVGLVAAGIGSTALTIAIYLGANLAVNQAMIASVRDAQFHASPMGPDLSWDAPNRPKPVERPIPTPTRNAANTNQNTAPQIAAQGSVLTDIRAFSFDKPIDSALFADGREDIIGVVTAGRGGPEVVRYHLTLAQAPLKGVQWGKVMLEDKFGAPFGEGDARLSPDANSMAQLVGATFIVWSFQENKVIGRHRPPEWKPGDIIRVLAYDGTAGKAICTHRTRNEFHVVTANFETKRADPWYIAPLNAQLGEDRSKDLHSEMVALSPDNSMLAVPVVDRNGDAAIRVYFSTPNARPVDHPISIDFRGVDFRDAVLDPTGICFSPDSKQVAVAYGKKGLTQIYRCPAGTPDPMELATSIMGEGLGVVSGERPAGGRPGEPLPMRENSLVWLQGGDYWLYGKQIADGERLRFIGTIDLGQPIRQWTVFDGRTLVALVGDSGSTALIQATISPTAPTTQP